jgi:hypothetical protein
MPHVTANVRGSGYAFGVETVGVDLQAQSLLVKLVDESP